MVAGLRLKGNIRSFLYSHLQLRTQLSAFLHALKRNLMSLQRILDNLHCLTFTLGDLLQLLGVLLLLLKHNLIGLIRMLSLLNQLLNDLLALTCLLDDVMDVNLLLRMVRSGIAPILFWFIRKEIMHE